MVTLTIKEAFASAFTEEAGILLTLVGVPDKATLRANARSTRGTRRSQR